VSFPVLQAPGSQSMMSRLFRPTGWREQAIRRRHNPWPLGRIFPPGTGYLLALPSW